MKVRSESREAALGEKLAAFASLSNLPYQRKSYHPPQS
jgi:hypothetical protein